MPALPRVRACAAHLAPVWMDADRSTDKAVDAVAEVARHGAQLVAFPESFIGGVRTVMHVFRMDLPHLDVPFVKAYPAETTEAFLDGHVSAFGFFGGVPSSILYDNTKLAVARILGDGRRARTRAFIELISHYLFKDRFDRPGKGNDKGKVEGLVLR